MKNGTTSQQARKFQRDIADAHYQRYMSQNGLKSSQEASRPSDEAPRPSQEVHRLSQEPPRSSQTDVSVVIPRALTDAERAAYRSYPEMDQLAAMDISGLSKPKKPVVDHTADRHLMSATVDQREKANSVVTKLQTLVSDILEAEDQLQPDTSGNQSTSAARFFQVDDGADIERPILQTQTQNQLDLALHKVVYNGRFGSIDVEQLGRVMKLCENVITLASSTKYTIDSDTPHELDDWTRRIALCEQGLFASRSLLRIMTAGREEKQLYSEDTLRSLLNLLSHVADTCIIPIVEMRSGAEDAFKVASTQHKALFPVVSQSGRVLKLLGDLLSRTDVDESAITSAEFICKRLIFVENASSEKEAALGVQKFETLRLAAMDVLAKIFARYTGQRQFIFDEILTSLEKLPVSRQSARQFKLVDGKPIQLVSALLMRLVQTSATRPEIREQKPRENTADETDEPEDSDMDAEGESDYESESSVVKRSKKKQKNQMKGSAEVDGDLKSLVTPLYDAATKDAYYMINYLLQRAMTSTKTGDQPYRNLLDIFTEDFLGVLGNTDWPAAEMLLRALLAKLLDLTNSNKSSAPAKSMALELMGSMATRITSLRLQAQQAAKHQQTDVSEIKARLSDLHEAILEDSHDEMDLLVFDGPNRALLEYLHSRDNDDPQLQTARGYHVMRWSKQMLSLQNTTAVSREVEKRLTHMIKDPQWLESEYNFPPVSTEDGRFASILITLHMPFCLAFNKIFTKLLSSMGSDQASLRSKSLKSIEQLLEMDPAILDRGSFVMNNIIKCLTDTSTQVRDSALGLISKCLSLRPRLDSEVCERIVQRSLDANIHVRKRAMKMLKDIYLRNSDLSLRSHITDALVLRVVDPDESVAELARHTFEDIWMIPLHSNTSSDSENIKIKSRLQDQTALIVKVANKRNDGADTVLAELVQGVLSTEKSKNAIPNFKVCSQMVKAMFEAIIDPAELPGKPSQQAVLQTLTVFAAADAKLFTPDQLHMLQPYVNNLSSDDNLLVYRCAIVILRHTLPHMRNLNKDFLNNIQQSLFASFQKLPKAELKEVASCLWMLDGELKNTDRLVRITSSVLASIKGKRLGPMDEASATKLKRLIMIAGTFVKAFDLDSHFAPFSKSFPEYKGNSVAALAVDNICPFTSPQQADAFREVALESVSMICQSWPEQLMRTDVCTAFEQVFEEKNHQLEFILITGLKEFFSVGDKSGGVDPDVQIGTGIAAGEERLGNTYVATPRDGATISIAQTFLKSILRVALSSADELALAAVQVIASINRQGLVAPKDCGPCFVALETCPDNKIANIAFQEHRTFYHKYESMLGMENAQSVQQAYDYQRDVIHNTLGYVGSPPAAKLHMFWEVLKTGTAKARKKFFSTICTKINFEPAKLDLSGDLPSHVDMVRFIIENLAFFDYTKLDELQHLTAGLEKVVSDTGTGISHTIEVEVLRLHIEDQQMLDVQQDGSLSNADPAQLPTPIISIAPARLRQLTIYSQILLLIWELRTYLRRLWNLSRPANTRGRQPAAGKDAAARAPTRIPNSTNLTERFLARTAEITSALAKGEKQRALCAAFAELMAVDNELKVAAEDDEDGLDTTMTMNGDGYETPSEGSARSASAAPGSAQVGAAKRGKKRKSIGDSQNTPKKRGRQRKSSGTPQAKGRRKSKDIEDEVGGWN